MPQSRNVLFAAIATAFAGLVNAVPVTRTTLTPREEWAITSNNTINSTTSHSTSAPVASVAPSTDLTLSFVNNFSGNGSINAYMTGLDGDGAAFFLTAEGKAYYPSNPVSGIAPTTLTEELAIPLGSYGETVNISLPNYVSSGRIYFSVSALTFAVNYGETGTIVVAPSFTNPSDPNINVSYGFVEFTWDEDAIYSNLSYVDYIGLVISQLVSSVTDGVCEVLGLPADAVATVCSELAAQAAIDGQAWDSACQTDTAGNYIRVLAPLHLTEVLPTALADYYDDYITEVWDHYTDNTLTITAGADGNYTGSVASNGNLTFDHGGSFAKPSITDILGCNSGPFANPSTYEEDDSVENTARQAIVPRLCAAFTRSTLLLEGGNIQPDGIDTSQYYTTSPTDHYSRIVHEVELDGKGYAFAYDDVHPDDMEDVSGLCVTSNPTSVTFTVGGSTSSTSTSS